MGTKALNKLHSEVLLLPEAERAELAHALVKSLDAPSDADVADAAGGGRDHGGADTDASGQAIIGVDGRHGRVAAAPYHGHATIYPAHRDRGGGIGVCAVAQLAPAVMPPALHRATGQQRAAMDLPRRDRRGGADAAHHDRGGEIGVCAVAQLAIAVIPPALHHAAGEQRAAGEQVSGLTFQHRT